MRPRIMLGALWLGAVLLGALWLGCGGGAAVCPTPAASDSILITIEEHTENGTCKVVPPTGVTEVDVNSALYLRMNADGIKKRMAVENAVDPVAVSASTRRLELLQGITQARARETEHLAALIKEIDTLDQSALSQRVMAFGKLRGAFRATVGEYAEFVGHEKSDFLRPRTGDALIQKHLDEAIAKSEELMGSLQNVAWRVEAQLSKGRGSVQLHIDNYDELEAQAAQRINKMAPPVPADVAKQLEAATRLAHQVNELKEDKSALGKLVVEQLTARFKELLGERLNEWEKSTGEISEWTKNAGKRPAAVKAEMDRIEGAIQRVRDVFNECRLLRELADGSIPLDESLLSRTSELYSCIDTVDAMLDNTPGELRLAVAQLRLAISRLEDKAATIPPAADELVTALTVMVTKSEAWKRATSFIKGQRNTIEQPSWQGKSLTERHAGELVDGRIELMRSPREVDDLIHLRASIVEQGAVAEVGAARSLRVISGGMRVDVGPALVFIQPFDQDDRAESFRATPAISATLHYRSWRGNGETSGNRLWNFLDMGIGVHLAYPDLGVTERDASGAIISNDPAAEVGVGGTLHFFGDVFQVGAGYDLQVETSYWFIGLGIQRLTDFGISLPTDG